jgi:transcriptional regulator PpsR
LPRKFKAPDKSIGTLPAERAAELITALADVAIVIDRKGVVRDYAIADESLAAEIKPKWSGVPWSRTVTAESRPKIEALLSEAQSGSRDARARQVNHPAATGGSVPILYSAVRVARDGHLVALGRDLRNVAALQQRLIDAEQSMEREYARLRQAETRYRMLFQLAGEPVLIVEADSARIVEANPAAAQLLGEAMHRLVGKPLLEQFDAASGKALRALLDTARARGHGDAVRLRLAESAAELLVSASHVRQDGPGHCLVRMAPGSATVDSAPGTRSKLVDVIERLPDGFAVTALDGSILAANRAFLELTELTSEDQARGKSLERWLGRPGVDLGVLLANLKQHGAVRSFATSVRGEFGALSDVDISAVAVSGGEQPCLGFSFRNVTRRAASDGRKAVELPRSAADLKDLVGRVAIKDLVRQATDVIERLCIEAALEITGDNRASAAEMLGMSRQSFYVKLRRYGLGDLENGGK